MRSFLQEISKGDNSTWCRVDYGKENPWTNDTSSKIWKKNLGVKIRLKMW